MKSTRSGLSVLWCESFGFGVILLLCWFSHIPPLLTSREVTTWGWRDSLLETVVILLTWTLVFVLTKRLLERLHYLEGMLRVCAWCGKVAHDGRWMPLQDYFSQGLHISTTHGVCPDCMRKVEEDTKQYYLAQQQPPRPAAPEA